MLCFTCFGAFFHTFRDEGLFSFNEPFKKLLTGYGLQRNFFRKHGAKKVYFNLSS